MQSEITEKRSLRLICRDNVNLKPYPAIKSCQAIGSIPLLAPTRLSYPHRLGRAAARTKAKLSIPTVFSPLLV